jgi:hypothetical protein
MDITLILTCISPLWLLPSSPNFFNFSVCVTYTPPTTTSNCIKINNDTLLSYGHTDHFVNDGVIPRCKKKTKEDYIKQKKTTENKRISKENIKKGVVFNCNSTSSF